MRSTSRRIACVPAAAAPDRAPGAALAYAVDVKNVRQAAAGNTGGAACPQALGTPGQRHGCGESGLYDDYVLTVVR